MSRPHTRFQSAWSSMHSFNNGRHSWIIVLENYRCCADFHLLTSLRTSLTACNLLLSMSYSSIWSRHLIQAVIIIIIIRIISVCYTHLVHANNWCHAHIPISNTSGTHHSVNLLVIHQPLIISSLFITVFSVPSRPVCTTPHCVKPSQILSLQQIPDFSILQ